MVILLIRSFIMERNLVFPGKDSEKILLKMEAMEYMLLGKP